MNALTKIAFRIATENADREYWSYQTYSRFLRVCRKAGLNPVEVVEAAA